jgi:hypothetical protein
MEGHNERTTSRTKTPERPTPMSLLALAMPVAAVGYSLLYLLFGGGLVGAIVIFIIAKMFRR